MVANETPEEKATRLLKRQLEELEYIERLNSIEDPKFEPWRDTTKGVLERFLGKNNHHTFRFINTRFLSMVDNPNEDQLQFHEGCRAATETLRAAIREIEDFGVHEEQPKAAPIRRNRGGNGGVMQTFNAPVNIHNLAIAADDAVQKIGRMGDSTGASLKEIAELLQQSEELSPREVKEGLTHIEAVAVEVAKPEAKRDWNTVLKGGNAILDLTNKATDLATKFAPYTPAIFTLLDQAKHYIK